MPFDASETLAFAYQAVLDKDWSRVYPLAKRLYEHDPTNVRYIQLYASCFFLDESRIDHETALRLFNEAVPLNPDSEQTSMGRFHCLLALGRIDEAYTEVRRYSRLARWEGYKSFLPAEDEEEYRS